MFLLTRPITRCMHLFISNCLFTKKLPLSKFVVLRLYAIFTKDYHTTQLVENNIYKLNKYERSNIWLL